jgi:hypothetical protein
MSPHSSLHLARPPSSSFILLHPPLAPSHSLFLALLATLDPEMCISHIEECINRQEPLFLVLRLLCLYSLTYNGIPEKIYNFVRREILQTYGFRYLFVLEKLNKLGIKQSAEEKRSG